MTPHSPAIGWGGGVAGKRPQVGRDSECPRRPPGPLWAERASLDPLDKAPWTAGQGREQQLTLLAAGAAVWGTETLVSAASVLQRGGGGG